MSFEIKVTLDYNGVKPKNFLKKKLDVSFFKIPRLIKEKRITLNGKKIKENSKLKTGDIIKIWPNDIKIREIKKNFKKSKNLNLDIIFENKDLIVFNKLPFIIVQGAQDNEKSLSLHLAYYKNKIKDKSEFEYFHVHRLDKETSGVLVIAKNRNSLRDLNKLFRTREVHKKYLALVIGSPKKKKGKIEVYMMRNPQGSREKMRICNLNDDYSVKNSISKYNVIEEIEHNGEIFSLVEIEILTGITHQIRVHMKYLGTPIIGDKMYGNSIINQKYSNLLNRQFLHAKLLEFVYNDKYFKFKAPLTKDLSKFLNHIKSS